MNNLSLADFLRIDVKNRANLDSIFSYVDSYLNEIQSSDFAINKVNILDTIINKYIDCCSHLLDNDLVLLDNMKKYTDQLKTEVVVSPSPISINLSSHYSILSSAISSLIPLSFSFRKQRNIAIKRAFNLLYSEFIATYKRVLENSHYIEFEGYFNPDNTSKDRIKFLIEKCIRLIEEDTSLKKGSKNKITKEFEIILSQLDSNNSNWAVITGKIREAIFILGALGGIATGAINIINKVESSDIKNNILETVDILHQIETELEDSVVITPEIFLETFTFSNKIRVKKQEFELLEPLKIEGKNKEEFFTDYEEVNSEKKQ
ncbi:hypothetical protein ACE193_06290 [Bernardetia sp. OM2101]|uniref:hypothetical protein n=1 Tax=Bernardetia sp. OM2101 TaxID=3344876 RepID=UPI0035D0B82E